MGHGGGKGGQLARNGADDQKERERSKERFMLTLLTNTPSSRVSGASAYNYQSSFWGGTCPVQYSHPVGASLLKKGREEPFAANEDRLVLLANVSTFPKKEVSCLEEEAHKRDNTVFCQIKRSKTI